MVPTAQAVARQFQLTFGCTRLQEREYFCSRLQSTLQLYDAILCWHTCAQDAVCGVSGWAWFRSPCVAQQSVVASTSVVATVTIFLPYPLIHLLLYNTEGQKVCLPICPFVGGGRQEPNPPLFYATLLSHLKAHSATLMLAPYPSTMQREDHQPTELKLFNALLLSQIKAHSCLHTNSPPCRERFISQQSWKASSIGCGS
jgi:hypothetical protein